MPGRVAASARSAGPLRYDERRAVFTTELTETTEGFFSYSVFTVSSVVQIQTRSTPIYRPIRTVDKHLIFSPTGNNFKTTELT